MILDYLKRFMSRFKTNTINKSDIEKLFVVMMNSLKSDVRPIFEEMLKSDKNSIDSNIILLLNKSLIGKTYTDVLKSYIVLIDKIIKNEPHVKKLISTLPEVVTTNSITAKKSGIISLVDSINTFILLSNDVPLMLIIGTSKDFPAKVFEDIKKNIISVNRSIILLQDIEGIIKGLEKANDEININEDNVALENILKSKGELNFQVSNFIDIPKAIYTFRTWRIDEELEKYELLKLKKQYLLKRLIEIESELNKQPEDVNLKKAKDVYIKEINKISFKIERIEQN